MGDKQFNHTEALSRAYAALYALRREGRHKPPLTEVAKRSGIQRSTMYTDHKDWEQFREITRLGLPLKDVTQAGVELVEEKAGWVLRLERLEHQLVKAEQGLQDIKVLLDSLFTKLTAQLHKYVLLSKETPHERDRRVALLKENAEIKQEIQRIRNENAELRLQTGLTTDIRPLTKKEVLIAYDNAAGDQLTDVEDSIIDMINSLDDYFAVPHGAHVPAIVYILCGNFASGKSRWIKEHTPLVPGVNLYIDGTNHTTRMRKLLLKRIKKLNSACTVACVRVRATQKDCLKHNEDPSRVRAKKSLPGELIMRVASKFEEISIDEGFDQIIFVGQD